MIEINNKWAIGAEKLNIILYHKSAPKKVGKEPRWAVEGYYGNLHNVLTALVNKEVKETHLESLKVVTKRLDEIYGLIKKLPQIRIGDLMDKE